MAGQSEFAAPTRIVAGLGCTRRRLGEELGSLGAACVAVIADLGFERVGLLEPLLRSVADIDLPVCALIGEDPDLAEAERAGSAALEAGATAVLGIGGGSALCAAKAAAIRLSNPRPLAAYAGREMLDSSPAPVIGVPTTAGSGSEVSNVVVLHEPGRSRHLVIHGRGYAPTVALLDGEMLRTLPRRPLVAAALDALSHALEALWAHGASSFTDALALAASRTIRDALPGALADDDHERQRLIEASAMANLACGNSGLGLVHALTSAPGVRLPHGYQNGVLLPHVAEFNLPTLGEQAERQVAALSGLYAQIGFNARFASGELAPQDRDAMVTAALANPFRQNNRRLASESDLQAILRAACPSSSVGDVVAGSQD